MSYISKITALIVIIFSITLVTWGYSLGPFFDSNYAILDYESRSINIIFLLLTSLTLMAAFIIILKYNAEKKLKELMGYKKGLLVGIGVWIISILIMLVQILIYTEIDNVNRIELVGFFGYVVQAIWIFFSIKVLLKLNIYKTVMVIINSLAVWLIFMVVIIKLFQIPFYYSYKNVEKLYSSPLLLERNIEKYENLIKKCPNKAKFHYFLAESYGNYVNVEEYIKQADQLNTKAEIEYKKALSINPHFLKAKIGLGKIYFRQKKYKPAKKIFEEVLKNCPKCDIANQQLEKIYSKLQ